MTTDYLDEHAETEGEGDEDDEPGEGEEDPAAHADAVARVLLRWRGGRSPSSLRVVKLGFCGGLKFSI